MFGELGLSGTKLEKFFAFEKSCNIGPCQSCKRDIAISFFQEFRQNIFFFDTLSFLDTCLSK